ncbi:hypothetical protein B9Z55_005946 [Caenorhabditis nigoni]|uniref:DUF281 domain-containing protein n=1 Tax=Caenorhabditis nigoni TaxID=1611254 RepID=A0A2G5V311_9PELO|nr:hypothetical protein B9Z55_005946 [Caenorhabditis nigoni]
MIWFKLIVLLVFATFVYPETTELHCRVCAYGNYDVLSVYLRSPKSENEIKVSRELTNTSCSDSFHTFPCTGHCFATIVKSQYVDREFWEGAIYGCSNETLFSERGTYREDIEFGPSKVSMGKFDSEDNVVYLRTRKTTDVKRKTLYVNEVYTVLKKAEQYAKPCDPNIRDCECGCSFLITVLIIFSIVLLLNLKAWFRSNKC